MKYAWIKELRDKYSVVRLCRAMQVSKSGFYKWLNSEPSARNKRTASIRDSVMEVFQQSNGIYGSYKIAQTLKSEEHLETACRNTVAKAMKDLGIKSRVSRKFKPTTTVSDPSKKPAPNILAQDFKADAPNQKWVADITYLPTLTGWVYLAVVIDLFSRKVVGWKMSDRLTTPIVTGALKNAIESRKPNTKELLHHSDRGCQYTSEAFQKIMQTTNITCSMSRTGCCYDNAVVERFFWSLKHEWTKFEEFENLDDARLSVFKYIDTFYNTERIHQTLEYQTPDEVERKYRAALAA
jgi:putative transposase